MDGETLPQLFEEGQIQRDAAERVKHTKHLARHSAGGEVAITCEADYDKSVAVLKHQLFKLYVKMFTYSCDYCASKKERAAKIPVSGVG